MEDRCDAVARKKKTRYCKCCGEKIEPWNLWVCDDCQGAGLGTEIHADGEYDRMELLSVARKREKFKGNPLSGMTIDEIALLARSFVPPYCTYGGLRGYVDGHGKLPPASLQRKSNRF